MNRSLIPFPTLLLAAGVAGCAGGPPVVDVEPIVAGPAEVPLRWFTETYGPYDASVVGPVEDGPGGRPLLLVDGVQPDGSAAWVEPLVREATRLLIEEGPNRTERIRDVIVYKHRCDTEQFGPAGAYGAIMIFRAGYEGPMPEPWHSFESGVCRGAP